jgi:CRP-like cAMP-binding protein
MTTHNQKALSGTPPEPVIDLRLANRLLAQLDEAARNNLLTGAELVEVTELQPLGHAGQPLEWVYFPVDCMVSLLSRPQGQRHFEIGLIGFEGMLGAGQALGVSACAFDAVVTGSGRAWRIELLRLQQLTLRHSGLNRLFIHYLYFELSQMGLMAACGRFHSLAQRLARLLLMCQDRMRSADLRLTHETMAAALGMRRVGVTLQAGLFQDQGLIQYSRGQILVLDRCGLQHASCNCYALERSDYEQMLKP